MVFGIPKLLYVRDTLLTFAVDGCWSRSVGYLNKLTFFTSQVFGTHVAILFHFTLLLLPVTHLGSIPLVYPGLQV